MKILLDENLPHRLRNHLGPHEVVTVRYQGWSGLKNGELLRAAEAAGFEVFLTGDQTLSYEQNLSGRKIAVLVLTVVEWLLLSSHLSRIAEAIDSARDWKLYRDRLRRVPASVGLLKLAHLTPNFQHT